MDHRFHVERDQIGSDLLLLFAGERIVIRAREFRDLGASRGELEITQDIRGEVFRRESRIRGRSRRRRRRRLERPHLRLHGREYRGESWVAQVGPFQRRHDRFQRHEIGRPRIE